MNFSEKLMRAFYRYRVAVFLICAAIFIVCAFVSSRAKFNENIYDLLPVGDKIISGHLKSAKIFGQTNSLYFNFGGVGAESAMEAAAAQFKKRGIFTEILDSFDSQSLNSAVELLSATAPSLFDADFESRAANMISKDSLKARILFFKRKLSGPEAPAYKAAFICDPLNLLSVVFDKLRTASDADNFASANRIISGDGKNFLMLAKADFDPSDSAKSSLLCSEIEDVLTSVKKEFPTAEIAWCGGYRTAFENAAVARRDSSICFAATLALMFALCLVAYRNRIFAVFALLPSLMGTTCAFCIMCAAYTQISTIAIAFASIAVGVSIDYAVHILCRLDRTQTVSLHDAGETAEYYKRPVSIAAGTTMAAFVIMYFSGAAEFAQLGAFGAVGVLFSALVSVFLLPVFTVGFSAADTRVRRFDAIAERLSVFIEKRSGALFIIAVSTAIFTLPFAFDLKFDGDVSNFNGAGIQCRTDEAKIRSIWKEAESKKLIVLSDTSLEDLLKKSMELSRYLTKSQYVKKYNSLSSIIPDAETVGSNLRRWLSFYSENEKSIQANFAEAAAESGLKTKYFDKAFARLKSPTPINPQILYTAPFDKVFAYRAVFADGKYTISTFVDLHDNSQTAEFAARLHTDFPTADYVDMEFFGQRISALASDWLLKFALASFCAVALYLYAMTRRLSNVTAVLTPVVVGLIWCFAIMGVCGINVNLINAVFIIFAVCVAQDYGVFLLNAKSKSEPLSDTLAAVLISAFTTLAAFGTLAFASHPVLKSLGQVAAISILSILAASLMTVPQSSKMILKNGRSKQ